jgi:Mn-dependent DtxR family transcriptional regulator
MSEPDLRIRTGAGRGPPADQGEAKNMATTYHVSLFIQVPDEGETEAWQVEHALRDAAEEHLWQIVSLTVVSAENP